LGVIEAKDWKRRVNPEQVDAFVTKAKNINANLNLMVSKKGFTAQALRLAKAEGIGTYSLVPNDPEAGFSVGITVYAVIYRWTQKKLNVEFTPGAEKPGSIQDESSIKYNGQPVGDWFLKELSTKYATVTTEGPFSLPVTFKQPTMMEVDGNLYPVVMIRADTVRTIEKKKRFLLLTGDGFYNWATGKLHYPAGGQLVTEWWRPDMSDWDDYDGPMPDPKDVPLIFTYYWLPFEPNREVVDLGALGEKKVSRSE